MPVVVCGPALWFLSEPDLFIWFLCLRKPNEAYWPYVNVFWLVSEWVYDVIFCSQFWSKTLQKQDLLRVDFASFCLNRRAAAAHMSSSIQVVLTVFAVLNATWTCRMKSVRKRHHRVETYWNHLLGVLVLKHFNHWSIDISQGTMLIICRHLLVFKDFRHRGTAIRQR